MKQGWIRRLAGVAVLVAATGTTTVLAASPANAALPGLVTVYSTVFHTGASPSEIAIVNCPAGKVPIGTGWSLSGVGGDEVSIQKVYPSGSSVVAVANEDETGVAGDWELKVYANCANQPAGYEVVTAASLVDSSPSKNPIASCTSVSKRAYGTGFVLDGAPDQTVLTGLNPGTGAVQATAYEDDTGTLSSWSVTAYAICANSLAGSTIVGSSNQTLHPVTIEAAVCPAGKVATGTGAYFTLGGGDVGLQVSKTYRYGGDDVGQATGREDEDGAGAVNWDLTTEVVCVSP